MEQRSHGGKAKYSGYGFVNSRYGICVFTYPAKHAFAVSYLTHAVDDRRNATDCHSNSISQSVCIKLYLNGGIAMNNQALKDIIVLVVILVVLFIICQFLPQEIPFHINARGVADMTANKYFLLLGAVIPYSAYWSFIRNRKGKK